MQYLIINFWYGRIPLWKSYWLIGELINSLVILLILFIEIKLLNKINLYEQLPFFNLASFSIIGKFTLFLWTIFITVGIWRSAEKYKGNFIFNFINKIYGTNINGNFFWILITLILLSYRFFTLRLLLY
mgnify:CR=1 FL=1